MDITLVLTHQCNLRCHYCYSGEKKSQAMSWDTAKRSLDFAFENFSNKKKILHFFGGEPLMEWDLLQKAVDYFEKKQASPHLPYNKTVTTNGTLLDKDKLQWLKEKDFYVGLSVDGNQRSHDILRKKANGEGSYSGIEPAIELFRDMEIPGSVILVADPKNLTNMYDGIVDLYQRGIRKVSFNLNLYTKWKRRDLWNLKRLYKKLIPFYIKTLEKQDPLQLNNIQSKFATAERGGCRRKDQCDFGEESITVAPSGNIYPCERIVGEDNDEKMRIGNVYKGFYEPRRTEILQQRGNSTPQCQDCDYRSRCVNWCGCMNYLSTGQIDQVDGVLCYNERILISMVDRVLGKG